MEDIIIIIDNWDVKPDGTPVTGNLGKGIITFIENNPNIKTAILASYCCSKELFSDTIWYRNRKLKIPNYHRRAIIDYLEHLSLNKNTWKGMLEYANDNVYQVAMRDIKELINYLGNDRPVNIYMAGAAWERCVTHRPLGYLNILKNFPEINLLVDITCIVNATSDTPDMLLHPEWERISDTLYRYIK
jgi:hypothetical protein